MARTAGIVLIGNEILSGKVVDANASYLCRELRGLGVEVRKIVVIPDEVELIAAEVGVQVRSFDLVFTSGGVGPTHDDVTMEGVARALGVSLFRDPHLVQLLEELHKGRQLNEARLKMAEVPEGSLLVAGEDLIFPAVVARNVYILPGVPEIFRRKFEALRERFREAPFHLCSIFVNMAEGTLADHLNELLTRHPDLMLGSYPEFFNPEYKVKVTLESKDAERVARAADDLLARLPDGVLVRVERTS
jgi:molybdenum cofactor synthesis domain-containing protein